MSRDAVRPTNTSAIAVMSLTLGLLALLLCWVPVVGMGAFPLGCFAVILALAGLRNIRRANLAGRGLALAGLTTGGIGLLIATVLLITFVQGFRGPAWDGDWRELRSFFEAGTP
ncbi:MAG: DUF4190 domain-containing protein [Egibacteraceae bacterium]